MSDHQPVTKTEIEQLLAEIARGKSLEGLSKDELYRRQVQLSAIKQLRELHAKEGSEERANPKELAAMLLAEFKHGDLLD